MRSWFTEIPRHPKRRYTVYYDRALNKDYNLAWQFQWNGAVSRNPLSCVVDQQLPLSPTGALEANAARQRLKLYPYQNSDPTVFDLLFVAFDKAASDSQRTRSRPTPRRACRNDQTFMNDSSGLLRLLSVRIPHIPVQSKQSPPTGPLPYRGTITVCRSNAQTPGVLLIHFM